MTDPSKVTATDVMAARQIAIELEDPTARDFSAEQRERQNAWILEGRLDHTWHVQAIAAGVAFGRQQGSAP